MVHTHLPIGVGKTGPLMAGTPSELSLTPPHDPNLDEDKGRGKSFLESTAKYKVLILL
jgi:hypothetical protein